MITQEQLPMIAIPSMNDTHLEEMIIVNRLETAAKDNNISAVTQTLKELLEHTSLHFFNEEEMMKEALFPSFQTHKSEHDRHLGELTHLIKYFEEGQNPKAITAYVEGNLIPWLIHHIQTMDTVSALFLQERSAIKGSLTENY